MRLHTPRRSSPTELNRDLSQAGGVHAAVLPNLLREVDRRNGARDRYWLARSCRGRLERPRRWRVVGRDFAGVQVPPRLSIIVFDQRNELGILDCVEVELCALA